MLPQIIKAASTGSVRVKYKHYRTGEVLTLVGTLDPELTGITISQQDKNDHLLLFSVVDDEWKSIRVSTILEWKPDE